MTNRILPETLPALYRKHGVVPMQGGYWNEVGRGGCGMGITFYDKLHVNPMYTSLNIRETLDLDKSYSIGYMQGFDGLCSISAVAVPDSAAFRLGYADGAAGWAAVKDLAVTE